MGLQYSLNLTKKAGEVSFTLPDIRSGEELVSITQSVCPYCYRTLPATIVEREGKLYIRRVCPEHGVIEELYYGDVELYKKFIKWDMEGRGSRHIYTPLKNICPFNCGLCPLHKNHTALMNLVLTNRCNLSCWYCFFYAEASGYVYEPTLEQIVEMVRAAKKQAVAVNVQLTGGEPTLREDLIDIVRAIKAEGVKHMQLNTNGIKFAELYFEDPAKAIEYSRALRVNGVNTIYLSFDGVTPITNWKNHWEVPYILEVFRKSGMTSTVLVPTVIRGINDHEAGAIVKFAAKHIDVIRGVNFQPVSLTGLMKKHEREKYRITIPEVIKKIEEQTDGEIDKEAWFPVPVSAIFSRFIEGFSGEFKFEMDNHPVCGAATYVYVDREGKKIKKLIPITHFVDVEGLLEYLKEKWEDLITGSSRIITGLKLLYTIRKFIDNKKAPKEFDLFKILLNIIIKRSYEALGELHYKMLFVGLMHFMDLYNYDIQRVMRCNIHYGVPDGRLIPFCAFNIFEDIYRESVQKQYGIPLHEWSRKYGLPENITVKKYIRNRRMLESNPIYREAYDGIIEQVLKK
ncbi:MAG: radical SAM protein [Thermoprotei archaeon]|nr:MAG: radical SAM protein [Thermoprotei archaeon]